MEPKEPFELEPDYVAESKDSAKQIVMQQRLTDEQEIDAILEGAADPFGEVEEDADDDQKTDALIQRFLSDLRDLDVLSAHQKMFKE